MAIHKSEIFYDLFGGAFRYWGDHKPTEDEIEVEKKLSNKDWVLVKVFQNVSETGVLLFYQFLDDIFEKDKVLVHRNFGVTLLIYTDKLNEKQTKRINKLNIKIKNN